MSGKPDDIPQDVWDDAVAHLSRAGWHMRSAQIAVAEGILAERKRCRKIASDRAAICADACKKIEAGELYVGLETAYATENCARMEAEHIARLIDGEQEPIRAHSGAAA